MKNDTIEMYPLDLVGFPVMGLQQIELPVSHVFSPGIYVREIFMPAGSLVVGHKHKTRHLNIIRSGKAALMIAGEKVIIDNSNTFESMAGARKCLAILEDMTFMTIHANPDDIRDIDELERMFVDKRRDLYEEMEVVSDLKLLRKEYLK